MTSKTIGFSASTRSLGKRLRLVCAVLFVGLGAFAPDASADWTSIEPADFSMQPPPAPGSPDAVHDFEILHEAQLKRSRGECSLAQQQRIPSFDAFFGRAAGLLSASEFQAARPLVARVFQVAERISGHFKRKFARPRPFNVDPSLQPCVTKPEGAKAYPSSHATLAAVGACVLGRIYPERAAKIERYGLYLGELRFITGVHHPSDVVAGQELAAQICHRIFGEPDFVRELDAARAR